jgi:hypothetical protein
MLLLLAPQVRDPQITLGAGGPSAQYGAATQVPLTDIAYGAVARQKAHVMTHGRLQPLGTRSDVFLLTDGNARVLLIPGYGLPNEALNRMSSVRVEVRGITRPIVKKEFLGGKDVNLIEDPGLPPVPAPAPDLPEVSLTVLAVSETMDSQRGAGRAAPLEMVVQQVRNAAEEAGKSEVRVFGQFRGRNLFGDLPTSSQRRQDDWVLKDGEAALWVTGKAPRGKGWALNPAYKGDTSWWLEVDGRADVVDGVVYLRASRVELKRPPTPEPPE